jgi:hypothetical protein
MEFCMLRAKKPEAVTKRLKLFMFGPAGVGKTTAAIQFPRSYIVDCEKGAENYDRLINASESVLFQTTDIHEVIQEVKSLLAEPHDYRTLVIDPITTIYNDLLEKCEAQVGSEWGRHYGAANKIMKRLANLIMALDMNVVITAHAKKEYQNGTNGGLAVIGQTFDGWKQLDYWFDLVVELSRGRQGKPNPKAPGQVAPSKRYAKVIKTRLEQFPDGETFEWSYDTIRKRCDVDQLERQSQTVALATPEQVAEINSLLSIVRLPENTVEKWFAKAGVDLWEDMPRDTLQKCIDFVKNRFPATAAA